MTTYSDTLQLKTPETGITGWQDMAADNNTLLDMMAATLLSNNRVLSGGTANYTIGGATVVIDDLVVYLDGEYLAIATISFGPSLPQAAGEVQQVWIYVSQTGDLLMSYAPPEGIYLPLLLVEVDITGILRGADIRGMGYGNPGKPQQKGIDFEDATLNAGILTYVHSLDIDYPASVTVWDSNGTIIIPDLIESINSDTITADLSSYGPISGTWHISVRS